MVYAIEEMKIAAADFAACGGSYGKDKEEKAVLPPGGQAQGRVYAYADHLRELCHIGDAISRKCEGHFSMGKTIFAFFILNLSPKSASECH